MTHPTTSIRVRYCETDQMGVAHHSSYIPWLEVARLDWFRKEGSDYKQLEQDGYVLAVTRCEVNYQKPARFDEMIHIEVALTRASGVRLNFAYHLYRGKENSAENLIATAVTELACLSRDTLRPAKFPEEMRTWIHKASESQMR